MVVVARFGRPGSDRFAGMVNVSVRGHDDAATNQRRGGGSNQSVARPPGASGQPISPGVPFRMPEPLGTQVPLFSSLSVAYHGESAKGPKGVWIVRCCESQCCRPAAHSRRRVQRPCPNDVTFREQSVGFRQKFLAMGVVHLTGSRHWIRRRGGQLDPRMEVRTSASIFAPRALGEPSQEFAKECLLIGRRAV